MKMNDRRVGVRRRADRFLYHSKPILAPTVQGYLLVALVTFAFGFILGAVIR